MTHPASADAREIRNLLSQKTLTAFRQRAVIAERLGLSESALAGLVLLSRRPTTPTQLGARLRLTSGGTIAMLHRLERAGHVRRNAHDQDGRMVVVTADRETLIAVADLLAPLAKQVDAVALRTTPANRRAVTRYLREVVEISERCVEEMIRADRAAPAPKADVMWA